MLNAPRRVRISHPLLAGTLCALALLAGSPALADADARRQEKADRAAAIRRTLKAIEQEVANHGGSWEAWATRLKDYRDDIRSYVTDWKTYKWPWPAEKGYVFQGAAVQMQLLDSLEGLPEGEDPFASIVHFDRQLKSLGIDLIIAFIPSKLSVYPDYLQAAIQGETRPARAPADRNVSLATKRLMKRLLEADVEVVDLHAAFSAYRKAHGEDKPTWYQRDSHYLNRGARLEAEVLAERLQRYGFVREALKDGSRYEGKPTSRSDGVKADADVLTIVEKRTGTPYRDVGDSPVVIAGDSYPLYNQPSGHLPAQVAHLIGLPVTMKAQVGLSSNIPVEIARDRALGQRRVIIATYTERALAPRTGKSKWPIVDLPGAKATPEAPGQIAAGTEATGTVASLSEPPDAKANYPFYGMTVHLTGLTDAAGKPIGDGDAMVVVLAMRDRKILPVASTKKGDKLKVRLTPWQQAKETVGRLQRGQLPDLQLELHETLYWGELPGQDALTQQEIQRLGEEDAAGQ